MKTNRDTNIKNLMVVFLSAVMMLLSVSSELITVQAYTVTNQVPITCYTLSAGRVSTYHLSGGRYSYTGYIDGSVDKCVILQVKSDGYCKVKYPTSRGTRTEYVRSDQFFINTEFSTGRVRAGVRKTVYRKSNLSQSLGTVYASDDILIIGTSGNVTQIIYPISGGYKMGWISGKYSIENSGGSSTKSANIADGYYQIKSAIDTNYVLDVYGGFMDDEANIQIYHNCGTKNQGFLIRKQSDGYYTIAAIHSGKLLDVYKDQKHSGANVIQCVSNGGDNQKWKIVKTSDDYYSFISKSNGLYLDVNGGIAQDEINVQCYTGNGTNAQKFQLDGVTVDGKAYESNAASGQADALVAMAKSQVGMSERSAGSDDIIYNDWFYGRRVSNNTGFYPWCATFVSWCADQTGMLNSVIPNTANTRNMKNELISKGGTQHLKNSGYTPVHGDIIFFGNDASQHVGIVDYTSGNRVYYIDGNNTSTTPHSVKSSSCTLNYSNLWGFVTPAYQR